MGLFGTIMVIYHIKYRYLQPKTEQAKQTSISEMDNIERSMKQEVALDTYTLSKWVGEANVIDYGMIMICRSGMATIRVNFADWKLTEGDVITLFPNDMITITHRTDDFRVEALRYSAAILREASMQLEKTVYSLLKEDRCCSDSPVPTSIINNMFSLLSIYFRQQESTCLEQLVLYQLKAFFIGFYDYIVHNPLMQREATDGSPRAREIFNRFMMELEQRYKQSRDVSFYADLLHITPKYLNNISNRMTGQTVKALINQYVILQIKQSLLSRQQSVKQIAWEYNFSDQSFFCRYFKQHTGLTPIQFMRASPV